MPLGGPPGIRSAIRIATRPASRVAESRFEALGALAREAALDLLHH